MTERHCQTHCPQVSRILLPPGGHPKLTIYAVLGILAILLTRHSRMSMGIFRSNVGMGSV